jgi:hypothetical protein
MRIKLGTARLFLFGRANDALASHMRSGVRLVGNASEAMRTWRSPRAASALIRKQKSLRFAEGFFLTWDLALFRRLQTGRIKPFGQMRRGVGPSCPLQQILALAAGRKLFSAFPVGFGLNAKPLFKRDRLFETSSLHDALPWFD